jgi:hypothetical protein
MGQGSSRTDRPLPYTHGAEPDLSRSNNSSKRKDSAFAAGARSRSRSTSRNQPSGEQARNWRHFKVIGSGRVRLVKVYTRNPRCCGKPWLSGFSFERPAAEPTDSSADCDTVDDDPSLEAVAVPLPPDSPCLRHSTLMPGSFSVDTQVQTNRQEMCPNCTARLHQRLGHEGPLSMLHPEVDETFVQLRFRQLKDRSRMTSGEMTPASGGYSDSERWTAGQNSPWESTSQLALPNIQLQRRHSDCGPG